MQMLFTGSWEEDFAYTNGYESVQFTGMNFSNYYSEVTDEYSDEYGGSYVNLHVSYNYDYTLHRNFAFL